jgi:hypothetical protein
VIVYRSDALPNMMFDLLNMDGGDRRDRGKRKFGMHGVQISVLVPQSYPREPLVL